MKILDCLLKDEISDTRCSVTDDAYVHLFKNSSLCVDYSGINAQKSYYRHDLCHIAKISVKNLLARPQFCLTMFISSFLFRVLKDLFSMFWYPPAYFTSCIPSVILIIRTDSIIHTVSICFHTLSFYDTYVSPSRYHEPWCETRS